MPEESAVPAPLLKGFDRLLDAHRPAVLANIRRIRRAKPDATPEQVIRILERVYLSAITTGGAAAGASAAVPGVGTVAALAVTGVETAAFLEASALFAQSVSEVHGIAVTEPERARALVMALMLGESGRTLVNQFTGQVGGSAAARPVFWGEMITTNLPRAMVGPLTDRLKHRFVKSFLTKHAGSMLGRLAPFGIGAVIGGTGSNLLGRRVIKSAREAFPPVPLDFRAELDPIVRPPRGDQVEKKSRSPLPWRRTKQAEVEAPPQLTDDESTPAN